MTEQPTFPYLGPLSRAIERSQRQRRVEALLDWADAMTENEELAKFIEWFGIHEA